MTLTEATQPLVEDLDTPIAAGSRKSGHVEYRPHVGSSPPDTAGSPVFAAIGVEGGNAESERSPPVCGGMKGGIPLRSS
jgi:hypothetical protein